MPAKPVSPPHGSDVLLIIGIAALLCGLSVLAGGLRGLDGSSAWAASAAPHALISEADSPPLRPSTGAPIASAEITAQSMADGPSLVPAPRQPGERFSSDGADGLDRPAIKAATARWTADWYVMRTSGDTRTYLVMSSAVRWTARWSCAIMPWDDTSGYGAVEASRAAIEPDAHDATRLVEGTGKESAIRPPDDPRALLLLSGAWSRERGQTGVRSSALHWATTTLGSEDLASGASRP